jgi:hypothetical protein
MQMMLHIQIVSELSQICPIERAAIAQVKYPTMFFDLRAKKKMRTCKMDEVMLKA